MMSDFCQDLGFNDAATPLYPNFPGVPPPWGSGVNEKHWQLSVKEGELKTGSSCPSARL